MNTQNVKFEISMNKRLNEMDECFNTIKEQVSEKIDKQIQKVIENFECKTNQNYNDMCKNVVVENKEINVESDKEDFVEVEFSNEVLLANADENERECEDSLSVEGEKRANFSCEIGEEKVSPVVLDDKGSSLVFVEDKRSFKCQRNYFCVSGKARCCNNVVLPSGWSEIMKCCGDESDYERERMVEIFKGKRDYEELIQSLNSERTGRIKNIPCVTNNVYIDDKYLPVNEPIVAEYGNNNAMVITKNTDGDFTNNTDVNLIYDKIILGGNPIDYCFGTMEKISSCGYNTKNNHMWRINKIEKCYIKTRLIFDDGG